MPNAQQVCACAITDGLFYSHVLQILKNNRQSGPDAHQLQLSCTSLPRCRRFENTSVSLASRVSFWKPSLSPTLIFDFLRASEHFWDAITLHDGWLCYHLVFLPVLSFACCCLEEEPETVEVKHCNETAWTRPTLLFSLRSSLQLPSLPSFLPSRYPSRKRNHIFITHDPLMY